MQRSLIFGLGLAFAAGQAGAQACQHTQDGLIYDAATGAIQRIVVPTCDGELADPSLVAAGQKIALAPHDADIDQVALADADDPTVIVHMAHPISLPGPLSAPGGALDPAQDLGNVSVGNP